DSKFPARKLLVKIVNNLTSKSEIGSPMASMYLLGHPDHYTSHKFVPLWWRSYVHEVRAAFDNIISSGERPETEKGDGDKVRIAKVGSEYVSLSTTDDYKFRPKQLEHLNVYEFTQMCEKVTNRKAKKKEVNDEYEEQTLAKENLEEDWDTVQQEAIGKDLSSLSFQEYFNADQGIDQLRPYLGSSDQGKGMSYLFTNRHVLHQTHVVKYYPWRRNWVPNFMGGSLPRSDQGDREYYCASMLALFKPWRLPTDIKNEDQSWDEAFTAYIFTPRQVQIMKNMNLRYECLDERDDHKAVLNAMGLKARLNQKEARASQYGLDMGPVADIDLDMDETLENYMEMNGLAQERKRKMDDITLTMARTGWLRIFPSKLKSSESTEFDRLTPSLWSACVKSLKELALNIRLSAVAKVSPNRVLDNSRMHGTVAVVDSEGLSQLEEGRHRTVEEIRLRVGGHFNLNKEQRRAYDIVTSHAIGRSPKQLKMYLGGMGGTGKSQVLKALSSFLDETGQSHRLLILGPTGTSAALINGST
ncbi:hypothetical protein PLEOSDRAFT_1010223, partial [Pleurotus ostreatus PC15]